MRLRLISGLAVAGPREELDRVKVYRFDDTGFEVSDLLRGVVVADLEAQNPGMHVTWIEGVGAMVAPSDRVLAHDADAEPRVFAEQIIAAMRAAARDPRPVIESAIAEMRSAKEER